MRGQKPYLVNTYTPNEVRLWCRLFWSKTEDLDIEELQEDFVQFDIEPKEPMKELTLSEQLFDVPSGHFKPSPEPEFKPPSYVPEWFFYEMGQEGLPGIIDPSNYSWPNHDLDPWAVFALCNGIAPFQPFLLRIPMPHYSRTYGDWGYEYDVEYDHEVIAVQPLSEKQKLQRWEAYFKSVELEIPWATTPPSSS